GAGRGQPPAVRGEGDAQDLGHVARERSDRLARPDVPDADRMVLGDGGEPGTVGAEGELALIGCVPGGRDRLTRRHVPEPDAPVVAGRGEPPAVWTTERHAPDHESMAGQVMDQAPGPRVPQFDPSLAA